MELKELGNTGVMVPEVGLGTARYTGVGCSEMFSNEYVA